MSADLHSEELFSVRGKTVLITGASSGLGWHFAELLAARHARLAVAARREQALVQLAQQLRETGAEVLPVAMDVTDGDSVRSAFLRIEQQLGVVNVVLNNAGIADSEAALQLTEARWQQVIDTNLNGAWRVATAAAQCMVAAGISGSIINILSILSFATASGLSSYGAAKAGLLQLTRYQALEFARHRIRVNGIAPGYIHTAINDTFFNTAAGQKKIQRIPQQRLGVPADLDGALLLLASDASQYMTGSTITVDGGYLCAGL